MHGYKFILKIQNFRCKCKHCELMPTVIESRCCQEVHTVMDKMSECDPDLQSSTM